MAVASFSAPPDTGRSASSKMSRPFAWSWTVTVPPAPAPTCIERMRCVWPSVSAFASSFTASVVWVDCRLAEEYRQRAATSGSDALGAWGGYFDRLHNLGREGGLGRGGA